MKGKILFNLNFDDPHPEGSAGIQDCGGDLENGVFGYLAKLFEQFPKLKVTLFVTPNWIDKPNDSLPLTHLKRLFGVEFHHQWQGEPFRLDKHQKWCAWLRKWQRKGNIEIAVHGFNHHNPKHRYHSTEFMNLPYEDCLEKIKRAESIFKKANLPFVKGFRPPGWGISDGLFKALKELNYKFISIRPSHSRGTRVEKIHELPNIPQNWSIKENPKVALNLLEKTNLIMAKGHISNTYGRDFIGNGLTEKHYTHIVSLLNALKGRNVKFVSMSQLCRI